MRGPVFTLPNIVSAVRISLVPVFLWLMFGPDAYAAAGWLLGGIGATDWVDGFLARRLGQVSEIGKLLDPVADRLAVAAAVVAGWITATLPWWIALLIVVREALVALGAAYLAARTGRKIPVRRMGKAATLGLYVAIPNFIIEAGTGYAFHFWVSWTFVIPGLALYYLVLVQYAGDVLGAARPAVSSDRADQEEGGVNVPEDRRYTDQHEWALAADEGIRVGITDYAQDALGDVVFVDLPEPGREVHAGEMVAEVESTKSVAEVYAPVAGTVAAANDELADRPELVNQDPYGAGWFLIIEPADPGDWDALLDAAGYRALIG